MRNPFRRLNSSSEVIRLTVIKALLHRLWQSSRQHGDRLHGAEELNR